MAKSPRTHAQQNAGQSTGQADENPIESVLGYVVKQAGSRVKMLNPFTNEYVRRFGKGDTEKIVNEYLDNLTIPSSIKLSNQAFDNYMQSQHGAYHDFTQVKGAGNDNLGVLINNNNAAKQALQDIVDPTKIQTAQTKFNTAMQQFSDAVPYVGYEYSAHALVDGLAILKAKYYKEIQTQQKREKQELGKLTNAMLGVSAPDFNVIKKGLEEALKAKHTEQLKTFEKEMNESVAALQRYTQNGREMGLLIARLHKFGPHSQKKLIELLAKENEPQGKQGVVMANCNNNSFKLTIQGVDVDQLAAAMNGKFKSVTGHTIHVQDGKYTINKSGLSDPRAFIRSLLDPRNTYQADFLVVATLIKAQGHDSIVLNNDYQNEKKAREMAKKALAASLDAGFKLDNITININGSPVSARDLLEPAALSHLVQHGENLQRAKERMISEAEKTRPSELNQLGSHFDADTFKI